MKNINSNLSQINGGAAMFATQCTEMSRDGIRGGQYWSVTWMSCANTSEII